MYVIVYRHFPKLNIIHLNVRRESSKDSNQVSVYAQGVARHAWELRGAMPGYITACPRWLSLKAGLLSIEIYAEQCYSCLFSPTDSCSITLLFPSISTQTVFVHLITNMVMQSLHAREESDLSAACDVCCQAKRTRYVRSSSPQQGIYWCRELICRVRQSRNSVFCGPSCQWRHAIGAAVGHDPLQ